jgi:hypothetical protein
VLLGHDLLAVARVWRHRERIEYEAADQFARLAVDLERVGAERSLVDLAARAACDEHRHAARCRRIVDELAPALAPLPPRTGIQLGPQTGSLARRTLYASVSMCCITETLSVGLLLHMQEMARHDLVRETVHEILRDEILHSRLGWAHLAAEARRGDVQWLAPHLPRMVAAAVKADLPAVSSSEGDGAHGILSPEAVAAICEQTLTSVIGPGFARCGIEVSGLSTIARPTDASP